MRSHISKALSGERMAARDRNADLTGFASNWSMPHGLSVPHWKRMGWASEMRVLCSAGDNAGHTDTGTGYVDQATGIIAESGETRQ